MSNVIVEIPNYEENITRPVAMSVVRQVAKEIGIRDNIPIRFIGTGGSLPLAGSTLDDQGAQVRLPGQANITIEVEEEFDGASALTTATNQPLNQAVFHDPALHVAVRPVFQRVKTNINFKVVSADKSTVDNWVAILKLRQSRNAAENLHTANYHWPVPTPVLLILSEIHRLREANQGYGENFGAWFKKCSNGRHTVITDQAGKNGLLVFKEQQIGILGYFDFVEQPPKPEKSNDTGQWHLAFTYTYIYDIPMNASIDYPLMVHNSLIDRKFYNADKPRELEDHNRYYSVDRRFLQDFTWESHNAKAWLGIPGIPVPHFDDWLPKGRPIFASSDVFRIMMQVDPANPHALISLYNLGQWQLKESALRYMRRWPISITQPYNCVFHLSLYRWDKLQPHEGLIVSPVMDVHTVEPLSQRENYHMVLGMLTDATKLTPEALRILAMDGEFAIQYLTTIYPMLAKLGLLPQIRDDGTIFLADLIRFVDALKDRMFEKPNSSNSTLNPERGWRLVNTFTINTHRRDQHAHS